jgi:opacity protein-like surface antigen
MKKLLIASAAILALATGSAAAAELTEKLSWDTEITAAYNLSDEVFSSEFETGLTYQVTSEVSAYGTLYADVKAGKFLGSEFGVVYAPSQIKQLSTSAYITLDDSFKNEKVFVEMTLKF